MKWLGMVFLSFCSYSEQVIYLFIFTNLRKHLFSVFCYRCLLTYLDLISHCQPEIESIWNFFLKVSNILTYRTHQYRAQLGANPSEHTDSCRTVHHPASGDSTLQLFYSLGINKHSKVKKKFSLCVLCVCTIR